MRLRRIAVVLVGALAFAAACDGDDTPSAEPSDTGVVTSATGGGGSPSTRPPTSTKPTPSSEPKATREGAIAAAKAAVKAIDHAYATWDVEPLEKISNLASCEACRETVERFPMAKKDGWTMEGGRVTFTDPPRVHAFVPSEDHTVTLAQVIVPFSAEKLTTRMPDGTIYRADDVLGSGGPHFNVAYLVTVRWNSPWKNKWRVEDVKQWQGG